MHHSQGRKRTITESDFKPNKKKIGKRHLSKNQTKSILLWKKIIEQHLPNNIWKKKTTFHLCDQAPGVKA